MPKQKIQIEKELKSSSQNIIWSLISDIDRLSHWLADDIKEQRDILTFIWGDIYKHHEIRQATIIEQVKYHYIRFKWLDEEDEQAYMELRMEKSDITGDYILVITDFAYPDEVDSMKDLWDDNLEKLHQLSGL